MREKNRYPEPDTFNRISGLLSLPVARKEKASVGGDMDQEVRQQQQCHLHLNLLTNFKRQMKRLGQLKT